MLYKVVALAACLAMASAAKCSVAAAADAAFCGAGKFYDVAKADADDSNKPADNCCGTCDAVTNAKTVKCTKKGASTAVTANDGFYVAADKVETCKCIHGAATVTCTKADDAVPASASPGFFFTAKKDKVEAKVTACTAIKNAVVTCTDATKSTAVSGLLGYYIKDNAAVACKAVADMKAGNSVWCDTDSNSKAVVSAEYFGTDGAENKKCGVANCSKVANACSAADTCKANMCAAGFKNASDNKACEKDADYKAPAACTGAPASSPAAFLSLGFAALLAFL